MFTISMLDLQHVLSVQVNDSLNIFKIIIFMNFIKIINNICTLMRRWMNQLSYSHDFKNWVTSFFFNMILTDKTRIAIFFKKSSTESATSQILIATNVYELDVDNSDVARVLQWLLLSSMSKLYQRLSWNMHCDNDQTNFTLLHFSWCIEFRSEKKTNDQDNTDQKETEMRFRTKKRARLALIQIDVAIWKLSFENYWMLR